MSSSMPRASCLRERGLQRRTPIRPRLAGGPVVPGPGGVDRPPSERTRLAIDGWVYCDGTVRSRNGTPAADGALQCGGRCGEGGLRTHLREEGDRADAGANGERRAIAFEERGAVRWCG
jgi:hypothetical protein